MPRLFVGTLIDPDEQLRSKKSVSDLKLVAPELFEDSAGVKFISTQKLHMTWVFIGDVSNEFVEIIKTTLAQQIDWIRQQELVADLSFDTIELWPDKSRPTLIVLTPSSAPQVVFNCAEKIQAACRPFQRKSESFPFRPHITLARLKNPFVFEKVRTDLLKSYGTRVLKLTDIVLFESASENHQIAYRTVATHKLSAKIS